MKVVARARFRQRAHFGLLKVAETPSASEDVTPRTLARELSCSFLLKHLSTQY